MRSRIGVIISLGLVMGLIACGKSSVEFKGPRLHPTTPIAYSPAVGLTQGGAFHVVTPSRHSVDLSIAAPAAKIQLATPRGYRVLLNLQGQAPP